MGLFSNRGSSGKNAAQVPCVNPTKQLSDEFGKACASDVFCLALLRVIGCEKISRDEGKGAALDAAEISANALPLCDDLRKILRSSATFLLDDMPAAVAVAEKFISLRTANCLPDRRLQSVIENEYRTALGNILKTLEGFGHPSA